MTAQALRHPETVPPLSVRVLAPVDAPGTATRGPGVAGVTRLPGPGLRGRAGRTVPYAQVASSAVQGTLALDLDPYPSLPRTPELRVLHGGPREIRAWVTRFAQGVVEVTGGDRGPQQLLRCMSRPAHAELVARCEILNAVARGDQRRDRVRAQVRSVHIQQPDPSCAEVSVHVRHGQRSRALAARIELIEGRWLCTALQFG